MNSIEQAIQVVKGALEKGVAVELITQCLVADGYPKPRAQSMIAWARQALKGTQHE